MQTQQEPTLKIGRDKVETPVSKVSDRDLEWYANECRSASLRAIASNEITRRKGGGAQAKPAQQAPQKPAPTALAKAPTTDVVVGSFDAARATQALKHASEHYHLVSPATVVGSLPEGCEVSISLVTIDPETECFGLTGRKGEPKDDDILGLSRVALDKIFAAAGGTWVRSHRLDDGRDPHYCAWTAVGAVRMFDGQIRELPGSVELDARDGSPQVVEIRAKAEDRKKKYPNDRNHDGGARQLLELRKFLLRHAESKGMNRAVAKLGIRRSYKRGELKKPFAVARVMFTGRSSDPEARALFQGKIADSFLGGTTALYGQPQAPALPPAGHVPHPAPPVGSVGAMDSDFDVTGDEVPPSDPAPAPAAPAGSATAAQQKLEGLPPDDDRGDDPNKY
jgi:hypothetical protein